MNRFEEVSYWLLFIGAAIVTVLLAVAPNCKGLLLLWLIGIACGIALRADMIQEYMCNSDSNHDDHDDIAPA
jgi:hypothetical protein